MSVLLFALLIHCMLCIKHVPFHSDYLSRETTVQINGLFVLLVFLSHFAGYLEGVVPYSFLYMQVRGFLDQLVVTTFLFYSGYGVLTSIRKKKESYVRGIPFKITELMFHFFIAVCLFVFVGVLLGKEYSISRIVLSFLGWSSVGNSNWYFFVIVALYGITYLSFTFGKKEKVACESVFFLSCLLILVLMWAEKPEHWYNTILCFWLGMVYAKLEPTYLSWLKKSPKNQKKVFFVLGVSFFISILLRFVLFFYIIHALVFSLMINQLSMILKIRSSFFKWIGSHIFSIYLLQRIPMIIGDFMGMDKKCIFIYFIFSFILTMMLAFVFDYVFGVVSKKYFLPMKKMNEG